MKFEISREGALKQLDNFTKSELTNYNLKRNFDLGPKINQMYLVYPLTFLTD